MEVEELTKKINANLNDVLGPKKGKRKQDVAAEEKDQDFIDHASYHDAPIEGEEEDAFGENDNLSRHSENEALQAPMSGESGADEDYQANKSDEDEESGKKKRKHDKDKKSKKIKKEKKDKKHKKDKKKHKKHHNKSDQEEEKEDLV